MSYFYLFARFYPVIAVFSAFIFFELALYFKRSGRVWSMYFSFLFIFLAIASAGLWLGLRGDQYSDEWVRQIISILEYLSPFTKVD